MRFTDRQTHVTLANKIIGIANETSAARLLCCVLSFTKSIIVIV